MGRGRPKGRRNGNSKASKKRNADSDDDSLSRMSSSSSVQALDNDGYTEPARKRTSARPERPVINYTESVSPSYDREYVPYTTGRNPAANSKSVKLESSSTASSSYYRESKPSGKEADMVVASQMRAGALHLLIKWKNSDEAEMIPAKEARYKYPAAVISYYEDKFVSQLRDGTQHSLPPPARKSYP